MKGFSLFELLFILLFLGILFVNSPRIEGSRTSVCKKVSNFLALAQNKAIHLGSSVNLEFGKDYIQELNSNNYFYLPKSSHFKAINFGNLIYGSKSITFNSEAWASAGSVVIASKNNTCKLTQSILGARRIE